jgi:signal transduction histidine kinase
MKKLYSYLTILWLLTCWLLPNMAAADSASRTVRIGYTPHPGFMEQAADGTVQGLGVEYFTEIAKHAGWNIVYQAGGRAQLAAQLNAGALDLIVPVMKTLDRAGTLYDYPLHDLGTAVSGLYVPENDTRIYWDDFAHMQGMRVGVTPGSFQTLAAQEYAREHGFTFTEVPFADYKLALAALKQHQVDSVALSSLYRVKGFRPVARTTYGAYYVVAKKNSDGTLLRAFDDAMEQITYDHPNFFGNLYEKYYGHDSGNISISLTRPETEYVASHPVIRIGCYTEWYPLVYQDKAGAIKGILIDVMQIIEKKSGLKFTYVPIKGDSSIAALKNKVQDIDLFLAVVATKARRQDKDLVLSQGYFTNNRAFAGRKNETFDITKPYKVVIPANIKGSAAFLKENYPQFEISTLPTLEACLRAVQNGKADAAFQNSYIMGAVLQHPEFDDLTIWDVSRQIGDYFYLAGRGDLNPLLLSVLNKYIDGLAPDDVQAIIHKHTANTAVDYTLKDLLRKYSLTIEIAAVLLLLILALVAAGILANKRHIATLNARNQELKAAMKQAHLASQAKSDFLSRMSHELRTPINVITGMTQIARKNLGDSRSVSDSLTEIEQASQMLLSVINDVLDMSAIEHQQMKVAELPLDLQQMLAPILTIYQRQCQLKNINFHIEQELENLPPLLGDGKRLTQVILNLLSNAFKFTPRGGTITLSVVKQRLIGGRQYLELAVADTGIGMSEAFRQRLFKPFEQESPATFEKFGGSGLGLSITQNLVKLMDGTINVVSAEGKGTTFTVNLPLKVAAAAAPAAPAVKLEPDAILPPGSLQGKHLLLAEDNIINQKVVLGLLKDTGAAITTADNGQLALELFQKSGPHTFDLILMDIQMPVLNGYETAQKIRSCGREDSATIPIIALSANAFTEDVSKSLAVGMNGHIAKPIDLTQMYTALAKFLLHGK